MRLVNVHPQLHIAGPDPQPKDQTPTVRVYSHPPNEPWYLLCLNTDGTPDATSPPYPTHQAATTALDGLRHLTAATADHAIENRAVVAPTSNTCRCSLKGWRCEHIDIELNTPKVKTPRPRTRPQPMNRTGAPRPRGTTQTSIHPPCPEVLTRRPAAPPDRLGQPVAHYREIWPIPADPRKSSPFRLLLKEAPPRQPRGGTDPRMRLANRSKRSAGGPTRT